MQKRIILLSIFFNSIFFNINASEGDTYSFSWLDPDKEVYVLQNRKFRKKNKFHLNAGGGISTSGAFTDSTNIQARAGYFFFEEWGFEAIYSKNDGKENSRAALLRGSEGTSGSTPFRRIIDNYYGAVVLWAPFYSKINTFNSIVYFDWLFGLGYGKVKETNNRQEFLTGATELGISSESHSGILWETSLKFYLSEMWDIRLNFTGLHYRAKVASNISTRTATYSNYDLSVAFGLSF